MILLSQTIKDDDFTIGFYKIEESSSEMLKLIGSKLSHSELEELNGLKHERRRCEWLASRILLSMLLGNYAPIHHEESGKPYIDGGLNISISHSFDMVAVMLSSRKTIGLDIEKMSDRIMRIEHKFMGESELLGVKPNQKKQTLYVNWCAKEAMYKAFNIKDFDFKDNFRLDSFGYEGEGIVVGHITQGSLTKDFRMHYREFDEYMATWCAEEE